MVENNHDDDDADYQSTNLLNTREVERRSLTRRNRGFVVVAGAHVGEVHCLDSAEVFIGRGSEALLRLHDDGISRRHAKLAREDGEIVLYDLNSANGTRVNDKFVTKQALRDGDRISLGGAMLLVFSFSDEIGDLEDRLYTSALHDVLTGLYKRRYFKDRLADELAFAKRTNASVSCLIVGIDRMEKLNEDFGPLAGDTLIAAVGAVVRKAAPGDDVVARWSGSSFGVLHRGASMSESAALAEKIREAVEAAKFDFEGKRVPVTVSIGVANYPELKSAGANQLAGAAEGAQRDAARDGRNRVSPKPG